MSNLLKKVTSAVAGLAIVFSVVSPIAGVSAAYTSLEAANKLATLGVIVDQSANPADYRLGDTISRREQVKLAMNLASCQAVTVADSCTGVYSDLSSSDWGCKYAESAYTNGFIAGNAMFNPNRDVSKAEALKMIMNATALEKGANTMWEAAYVEGGVAAGIVTSFSDYSAAASRGWIFQAAAEAVDLCGATDEEDDLLGDLLDGLDDEEEVVIDEEDDTPVLSGDSEAMVSLSPENPANGYVAVNTPRAMMMAFDVTAGDTDVTLEKATFFHVGLGDRANVDNVTIYNSNNEAVSKSRSFSDNDVEITFDRDTVVKAGETQTFMVGATIAGTGNENTTYQIRLTNLEANVPVVGGSVTGAALVPTVLSNSALLKVTANTASDNITIGEEVTLAGFTVEERNDNEDVIIKTITLHQNGSIDADYLEDLILTVDGEVVASGLSVNNDDEVVANIDFVLAADDKVEFELTGVITGDVNESVHFEFEGNDDIYAVGASTGFNVGFDFSGTDTLETVNIANSEDVEGAEIDAAFDRSDIDETKVDVDDVLVGTLSLTANSNDYEVTKTTVKVTSTTLNSAQIAAALTDVYLDGSSFDSSANTGANEVTYTFEDIILTQGVTEMLDVTFDLDDDVNLNDNSLTFTVKITEIEDDENNITYTDGGSNDVSDILSSNSFSTKSIKIETASFTLTRTSVNPRQLVLGNGIETVLYKGKISVGDSDDVTINDFDLTSSGTVLAGTIDFEDIMDSVELNIGGTTYDGDINPSSIEFSSINHVVASGSNNVEVLVTAVLKDDDGIVNGNTVGVIPDINQIDLEDSDGETVSGTLSEARSTITTLLDKGTFAVKVLNEVDTDDNLENTILAGESSVVLAEVEIEAEYEDIRVQDLTFSIVGATDFSDTLDNVRLVSGSKVLADGAVVSYMGGQTRIVFEDTVTFSDADDLIDAELVADLNAITGTGDAVTAIAGDIQIAAAVTVPSPTDVKGASSDDDITLNSTGVAGEVVSIVPTKLVFSVVETLSNGTAKVKVTADSGNNTVGNNNRVPEVTITQLVFVDRNGGDGYRLFKDGSSDQTAFIAPDANGKVIFNTGNFGSVDVTFDTSNTYVIIPLGTDTKTYTLELTGDVATYNINTTPVSSSTTTLDSGISLGSRTY